MLKYSQLNIFQPTDEMVEFFYKNNQKHIMRLNIFFKMLCSKFPELNTQMILNHDQDKYLDPLFVPYVFLAWERQRQKKDFFFSEQKNQAILKHVLSSPHHPEFYDPESAKRNVYYPETRINKEIVAYDMPFKYLAEMYADWCARSWEFEKRSGKKWALENIGKRFIFSNNQIKTIYGFVEEIERQLQNKKNREILLKIE